MAESSDKGNTVSLLGYSSIGFEKTRTEAFEDLRAEQASLTTRIGEMVRLFNDLKDKDFEGEELNASSTLQAFTESREELIDSLIGWYQKSGRQIAENVDVRSKQRVKRVHDFLEGAKRQIRRTRPLVKGEEEEAGTAEWLKREDLEFPEQIVPPGALDFNPIKERLRGAAAGILGQVIGSPRKSNGPLRSSTPESDSKKGGMSSKGGKEKKARKENIPKEKRSRSRTKTEEIPEEGGEEEIKVQEKDGSRQHESQMPTQIFAPATMMHEGERDNESIVQIGSAACILQHHV